LQVNHPDKVADQREKLAFATTAIFSRFPNEKPEKPIFVKKRFFGLPGKTGELSRATMAVEGPIIIWHKLIG
jgi:hypothetical protein